MTKFVGFAISVVPETVLGSPRAELPKPLEGVLMADWEPPCVRP